MPTAPPRERSANPVTKPSTSSASRLPGPVRERRPALIAFGLVLVVSGALASALVVQRSGDRVDVLVARHDIAPGELVSADDFGTARVAADGAAVVPASAVQNFVGTYATGRIPVDTLVTRTMFLSGDVVPDGAAVVGVVLGAEQRPTAALASGDVVRAYLVAADGSSTVSGQPAGTVLLDSARVVAAGGAAEVAADSGSVSLLVPTSAAGDVVAAAAAGQIALVRLADSTAPTVDLVQE